MTSSILGTLMTKQTKLLFVDDETTVRMTMGLGLQSKGFEVIPAASGKEALSLLKNNPDIDIVLLDIRMPEMSGNEVLQEIREKYSALELPVLMLTGTDETDAMVNALQQGANDYLVKPGDIEILNARIETQLSMKTINASLVGERNELRKEYIEAKVKSELEKIKSKKEINKRLKAEKSFIHSEKRYRMLYDNTPAMCFNLDLEGKILSVNAYGAYVLGYKRDELIGRDIFELYQQEDRSAAKENFDDVIRHTEIMHRWELRKVDKDGNTIFLRETAKLVQNMVDERNILMVGVDIADEHINISL